MVVAVAVVVKAGHFAPFGEPQPEGEFCTVERRLPHDRHSASVTLGEEGRLIGRVAEKPALHHGLHTGIT